MKTTVIVKTTLFLFCCFIVLFSQPSCIKSIPIKPTDTVPNVIKTPVLAHKFFYNQDWVGAVFSSGEYNNPCDLQFIGDSAVKMYSIFYLQGKFYDSLSGKITKFDSLGDGRKTLDIQFDQAGEMQTWYITNQTDLVGISSTSTNGLTGAALYLSVTTKAAPDLSVSTWSGLPLNNLNPGNPTYRYPDVSPVTFDKPYNTFYRHGINYVTDPYGQLGPSAWEYTQVNRRVYFKGLNETFLTGTLLYDYYGVILNGDTSMLVTDVPYQTTQNVPNPRLPNYVETSEPYGPNGVTPIIYKQTVK